MIEFKRIYIDTSPYIYYLEKNPQYSDKEKNFFMESYNTGKEFVTSTITVEEYAIVPYFVHVIVSLRQWMRCNSQLQ